MQTERNSFSKNAITSKVLKRKYIDWFPKRVQLVREFILLARRHGVAKKNRRDLGVVSKLFKPREESIATEEEKLHVMFERFPESTYAERFRFLRAKHGNVTTASKKLQNYLNWREQHCLNTGKYKDNNVKATSDEQDWNESYKIAMEFFEVSEATNKNRFRSNPKPKAQKIPQISFVYYNECGELGETINGNILLHIIPGLIDLNLATAETYALTMAFYLDKKFDREKSSCATVFLDVRSGQGWPNAPAYSMMPFIRQTAGFLHKYYPRRFDSCVIYNLPRSAMWIWEMVKPFLDRSVLESIVPIAGSDRYSALPPNDDLNKFADSCLLEKMEKNRLSFFVKDEASDF